MLKVLGGVVVVAGVFQILTGGKSKASKGVSQMAEKTISRVAETVAKTVQGERGLKKTMVSGLVKYDTWGERDPFSKPELPGAAKASSSAPLHVRGIVWMQGKPYVLINDVILTVGEEKKGIRVEGIEGRKVFCRKGGKMYTLQWSESP